MNNRVAINIKTTEDELFKNQLIFFRDTPEYYSIDGLSHGRFGALTARVNEIFENMSTTELLRKLEVNMCKVEINGVVFSLD